MSQSMRGSRRTLAIGAVAVSVLAAACVKPDDPEVAINKVEASLVFGVKPPAEPAPPPAAQAATTVMEELAPLPELEELEFSLPDTSAPIFSTLPKKKSDCEPAPDTAAAEKAVEVNITGEPPVGLYRWQLTSRITDPAGEVRAGKTFQNRFVRNLTKVSDTVYTFEQVQPDLGTDLIAINTLRVNNDPISENVDPGYNQIATVPSIGEPERGVTLDRIDYVDRTGNVVKTFTPPSGLLLLPLPVAPGERFTSVAVDPKSGQTIVNEMTVVRRGRVDACGELVDGWLVEGTQTMSGGGASAPGQWNYSYIVAAQYGGTLINERISVADADGTTYELEFTLGQLKPDPLPAGA